MHFHTPTNSSVIPDITTDIKSESKDKTPSKLLCSLNSDHSETSKDEKHNGV